MRNERTTAVIEQLNEQMERWTLDQLTELNATHHTRMIAEQAFKQVGFGRLTW